MNSVLTAFHSNQLSFVVLVLLLVSGGLTAQTREGQLYEVSGTKYLLGTQIELKAMHPRVLECKKAFYDGFQEIARIENLLSSHKKSSEIAAINRQAGIAPVKVSDETFAIIKRSIAYSAKFGGMFDVSIGPITELWGFNSDKKIAIPDKTTLNSLLDLVGYENVQMDAQETTVLLPKNGMRLDLGGIAKGYAIDRCAKILKQEGVRHFLVNAGGDIYASGYKFGHEKWLVGVQHPRKPQELLATFEINDYAVATSGDYERYAIINGQRYHHIINPKTGFPSKQCQSVTVFAASAEQADAWATYLFVIGWRRHRSRSNADTIESLIVDGSGNVHYDPALERTYKLALVDDLNLSEIK
ncbi:MAG: FAD:protein FMN transferase [bacterium]